MAAKKRRTQQERAEASITIAPRDDGRGASAQLWTRAAKGGGR